MNQEALSNIVAQAEEAIVERRLLDALALTDSILKDIASDMPLTSTTQVREHYEALLHFTVTGGIDPKLEENLLQLYQMTITELQNAYITWQLKNRTTTYGQLVKAFSIDNEFDTSALLDQIRRTGRSHLGKPAYHEALDAAFGFLWILNLPSDIGDKLFAAINKLDDFAVQTMISGIMLGTYEVFCPTRLRMLVNLARVKMETPIRPRALFSLYVAYARWQNFIAFYPDIEADIQKVFCVEAPAEDIAALNDAIIREQLTLRVTLQGDKLLPKITKMIEKQIKWLGSHDEDTSSNSDAKADTDPLKVNIIRINEGDEKLFNTMAEHAHMIDILRTNNFDVNAPSFSQMKRFSFFDHVAHFFYPFSIKVPQIAQALNNMKSKAITFRVMNHSYFCSSDAYSYLLMLNFVQTNSIRLKNLIDEQMNEFEDDPDLDTDSLDYESRLNPYIDNAQTAHRYFHSPNHKGFYQDPFMLNDRNLPTLRPALAAAFHDYVSLQPAVQALLSLQCAAEPMAIITWAQDTFGATAQLLRDKGNALMKLEMWHRAIEALSQAQLLDEDLETAHLIAQCHENLGAWEAALTQLQTVEAATTELNHELATEIVLCLIQSSQWDEAANRLFQLEFEGNKSKTIQRSIGWCSLHQHKYARAEQYYSSIIEESKKPSWQDFLNLGHAQWLQGHRAEAIESYRRFTKAFEHSKNKQSFRNWQDAFNEDSTTLLLPASSKAEIAVLIDAITLG